jgi:Immunity protein 8
MRPIINSIGLTDGDSLESFRPKDSENFCVCVRAMIGPVDQEGEESFDVQVCTPQALAEELNLRGYSFIRRRLIVRFWAPDLIREAIQRRVSTITADSWTELAYKLTEFADWEFENYQPAPQKI